ncbi:transglutaminase-like cysteine peptidase [Xanthobacteraceae bacterium Astr-EGSB]|uniref:transglutaminase-like cysteine peptidase n=1 Tax=Astrobacterium formosum TaxID=3069710 RepID=UPI0027B57F9B|nr:transglutaminase-like cysteine peptidase [Xanthobacteraceae bacterium Astr-EGSB]
MNIHSIVAIALSVLFAAPPAFATGPAGRDRMHVGATARTPAAWTRFCKQYRDDCLVQPSAAATTVTLTPDRRQELDVVNRVFNRLIEPVSDLEQYGMVEVWNYAPNRKGDCEDYVLEKRRRLIELGWPAASLLITVVYDKKNSGHAVLTVVTDQGDLVLDNVNDDMLPWWNSGFTFLWRQSAADPNVWVDLERTIGRPELYTATARR